MITATSVNIQATKENLGKKYFAHLNTSLKDIIQQNQGQVIIKILELGNMNNGVDDKEKKGHPNS